MRLIDADALIKLREEMWKDRCDYMVVRVTNIESAPTVDPFIHARWKGPDEPPHIKGAVCTNCGHLTIHMGNFCQNCGAKMDLKKDEKT